MKKLITLFAAVCMAASMNAQQTTVFKYDFSDGNLIGGWGNNSTREIVADGGPDGSACEKMTNPSETNFWSAQSALDFATPLTMGVTYFLKFKAKASGEMTLRAGFQQKSDYAGRGDFPNFSLTTEWKDFEGSATVTDDVCDRFLFSFGDFAGDIYLDDVEMYYTTSTGVEKVEVLNAANAEFVNAAGQKVGKNYKGLVINKATGKKFINK